MIQAAILFLLHLVAAFSAFRKLRKCRALSEKQQLRHTLLCFLIPFFWSLFTLAASRAETPFVMTSHNRGKLQSNNPHNASSGGLAGTDLA
jgi:Trk-type K+ transport system membrane component